MVFMFYRVYHISYKKEVPIMDADMKSFLYSAAFYHPLSDFVPISIQIYLRQKISICHIKNGIK